MANSEHLEVLKQGPEAWNSWRKENPETRPDLSGLSDLWIPIRAAVYDFEMTNISEANLAGCNLCGCNFQAANLQGTNFSGALLVDTNFDRATLCKAIFGPVDLLKPNLIGMNSRGAHLLHATFRYADFREACLCGVNLTDANLYGANLQGADLTGALLINTNLEKVNLSYASVFGISTWGVNLKETIQTNLIVSPKGDPQISVDSIDVAQFIYLLLNQSKLSSVLNAVTKRGVLILGRLRQQLRCVQ